MEEEKLESFKMQTRFDGLIKLLAEGLYSEKDIFVRELIQNAHDSIIRRKEVEPHIAGRIDVDYNVTEQTITFTDNGMGMDRNDIKEFLSVIGATGNNSVLSEEIIGQFGIGLLSAFVVADKVFVDTRKLKAETSFQWRNYGSETCELYTSYWEKVGSRITVFLRSDYTYFIEESKLKDIIVRYCDFIPEPIYLNGIGPINAVEAPWSRVYPNEDVERDAYYDFINRRFSDGPLDVFPFSIQAPYHAKGILYISDRHIPGVDTDGLLDVFIRRMLVKPKDTSLLPEWAKFIRGVIDSPDLKPTAARDNIQTSDPSFCIIKEQLGEIIVERLTYLAEKKQSLFMLINKWHHYHLKGMAYFHDAFFRAVADMLLFSTNKGMMSLKDYLPKNEPLQDGSVPIYYFPYRGSAAQYYRMADEKNLIVINAGAVFDEELLEKFALEHGGFVTIQRFDVLTDDVLFEHLSQDELAKYQKLEWAFSHVLSQTNWDTRVEVRRFTPQDIPAVIVESEKMKIEDRIKALLSNHTVCENAENSVWNEVVPMRQREQQKLALNAGNPLINGLLQVADSRLLEKTILAIYYNAMMYAHRMNEESMTIAHESMVEMMQKMVELYQQNQEHRIKLEETRRLNMEMRAEFNTPDHIRVFMITPYDEKYKNVEIAVRNVLEDAPYFFEIRLARDYTHSGGELVDGLQRHIQESHAFLADITELNPNVMMEIGAVRLSKDPRPLLVIKSDSEERKVADLGDKMWVAYGEPTDSIEMIEDRIRSKLEKDGEFRNGDIETLIALRKKRFLSTTLLKRLPNVKLSETSISTIRRHYKTIEELIEVEVNNDILSKLHLKEYALRGIIDELKEKIDNE